MRRISFALALMCAVGLASAADQKTDSPEDLKQLFDDKKFAELLPKLNKAIALKGPGAAQYDPYTLLHMKAESLLRTHSGPAAMQAFVLAAKASDKPDTAMVDTATASLIKQSSSLKYTPKIKEDKAAKPVPIDIVESDSRKTAFEALLKDLIAKDQPIVETAKKATSLTSIQQSVQLLSDLRPVEFAATGSDSESKNMLGDLGTKASSLVADSLETMLARVNTISEQADQPPQNNGGQPANGSQHQGGMPGYQREKPGLTNATTNELRQIISNATKAGEAAKEMSTTFPNTDDFTASVTKAGTVVDEAHKVLQKHGKEPKPKPN